MSQLEKSKYSSDKPKGRINGLTSKDVLILNLIRDNGPIDKKGIEKLSDLTGNNIMYSCWKLCAFGYLEFEERKLNWKGPLSYLFWVVEKK